MPLSCAERQRKYRDTHSEKYKEAQKRYREKNRLKLNARAKQWRKDHPEWVVANKKIVNERSSQWRIDNPDKVKSANQKWNERRKMIRICCIILKGAICNRCGYEFDGKNGAAFTFHHRNPEEKDFELSHNIKLSTLSKEIEKCDLVCERCHKLIHAGVIE